MNPRYYDIALHLIFSIQFFNSKGRQSVSKSLKRFGLEKKDFHNLPNLLNSSGDDEPEKQLSEVESTVKCSVSVVGKLKKAGLDKLESLSPGLKMMLAALTLVLMLLMAEQCVYYSYLLLCYFANLLSGTRAMFFSVPEIVSFESKVEQGESISFDMEKFKAKIEYEMDSLRQSLSRLLQVGASDDSESGPKVLTENLGIIEDIIKIKKDLDNQKIEHKKLLELHDHQNLFRSELQEKVIKLTNEIQYNEPTIETNSNLAKEFRIETLRAEIDNLKMAIESEEKRRYSSHNCRRNFSNGF